MAIWSVEQWARVRDRKRRLVLEAEANEAVARELGAKASVLRVKAARLPEAPAERMPEIDRWEREQARTTEEWPLEEEAVEA